MDSDPSLLLLLGVSQAQGQLLRHWGFSLLRGGVCSSECDLCLAVCAKSLQLFPILCEPVDYGPPGSSVHGILQAKILEWVAMPSSRGSSQPRKSNLQLLMSPAVIGRFFTTWEAFLPD